jgi:CRP/FNR family transcriptional regulator, cyclic AMP receptor protein
MDAKELRSVPLFAELSHRELEQVSRWADVVDVGEGRHLVDQGEIGYEFFAILDGTAEVLKDAERVRELGPGDFFGEIALLGGDRRTASVVATTPMRVAVMMRRDFQHMADDLPDVAERIRAAIRERT